MQSMVETIHATIELAARQGISQARISLEPAELGEIRIHLSQSSDGLLVRLTADTPAGAQALASGRGELHQALSSLGSTLLRLDIGSGSAQGGEGRQAEGSPRPARRGQTGGGENIDPASGPDEAGAPHTQVLGELVDVLA